MGARRVERGRLLVELADRLRFRGKLLRIQVGVEPIPTAMGFEVGLLLKNAPRGVEKCGG